MISFPISEMMDAAEKLCGFSQDDLAVLKQTLDNIAASPALLDAFSQIRQKCVIDLEFDDRPVCADENGLHIGSESFSKSLKSCRNEIFVSGSKTLVFFLLKK